MKLLSFYLSFFLFFLSCQSPEVKNKTTTEVKKIQPIENFEWVVDKFADIKILRYQIHGFDNLTLQQKKLVYYLTQAGLEGRDIIWDQNYRHNLSIRKALEAIMNSNPDTSQEGWKAFETYAKRVMFASGIHHHYSMDKFVPGFSQAYFEGLLKNANHILEPEILKVIFDREVDAKKVNLDKSKGLLTGSAVNFYEPGITASQVDAFYAKKTAVGSKDKPVSYGLNSKLVRDANGQLKEKVYSATGMYGAAITKIIHWLNKASEVAENAAQAKALRILVEYYKSGDLKLWDDYNVAWVEATAGDIDYINGFVEVYNDPKGYRGSYENIVQIKDFEASKQMATLANDVQWFEDNAPYMKAHKKPNVVGVSYKVVTVAGEAGDASPSTPIGVNLPNAEWIRKNHGSKSVSLGNIIEAYNNADGPGILGEFAHDEEELKYARAHGTLADKLATALHEVIGHASGQLEPGVATPKETLKSYASALEEARADLVALYYIMDQKMIELGLMSTLDVAKAEYDGYLRNGLMTQLRRIEPGADIEQAHMRNRQMIAAWAFEKGQKDKVVSKVSREGKTYFEIHDYEKLRGLFGKLLREVQRIKSQGDYKAGEALIENYGVKVDQEIHKEVLRRSEKLAIPPYGGFINPELIPMTDDDGNISDIKVRYPKNFMEQMRKYGRQFGNLPVEN